MARKPKKISRRKFIRNGLLIGAGLVAADAFLLEPRWIELERAEVRIDGLPPEFDGYRIGFVSDFHFPRFISAAFVRSSMTRLMEAGADVLLIGGDFVHGRGGQVPSFREAFKEVAAPDGVYGVLGNHDHWVDAEGVRKELAESTPVELIENKARVIERGGGRLALCGIGDFWEDVVDYDAAFAGLPPDMPRILLSHNPDVAEEPPGHRIDLQLSGHTHGGQVKIPFGPAPKVPSRYGNKYRAGLVPGPSHQVYVTRGVGGLIPVRFLCRPEATLLTLRMV